MTSGINTGSSTASSTGILNASLSATQGDGKGGVKAAPFAHAFESLTAAANITGIMDISKAVSLGGLTALAPLNIDSKITGIMGPSRGGKR